jgi:hypothetical protein
VFCSAVLKIEGSKDGRADHHTERDRDKGEEKFGHLGQQGVEALVAPATFTSRAA